MDLLTYTLKAVAGAIITPPLVFILVMLAIIFYLKNNKIILMQKIILGGSVNSSIELTLSQIVLGIIAGAIGSIILSSCGIVFDQNSGIMYLFLISMLLMFLKPRLICFSYSGAVLGGIGILIKIISQLIPEIKYWTIINIDIIALMMFVGILHVIEGLLVMIDGDRGAVPVFTSKDGNILGGYALNRNWVLPIALMIALTVNNNILEYGTISLQISSWWPLIKAPSLLKIIATSVISIIPFYAVLGYSSVTFTRSKREKAISSGLHILIYGIILMLVAQLARIGIVGEIIVIIFAPIGHEFMLNIQMKSEAKREPKFISDEEGLIILEIASDSEIREFGLKNGAKLLSINNKSINSEADIYSILKESLYKAVLKVKDSNGVVRDIDLKHDRNKRLGILLVPKTVDTEDILPVENNDFKGVLNSLKNKKDNEEHSSNKNDKIDDKNDKHK